MLRRCLQHAAVRRGAAAALQADTASAAGTCRALSATAASRAVADYSYSPPGRNHLFVPGPTNLHDRVVRAMLRQSENHRDPHFPFLTRGVLEDLKARARDRRVVVARRQAA